MFADYVGLRNKILLIIKDIIDYSTDQALETVSLEELKVNQVSAQQITVNTNKQEL